MYAAMSGSALLASSPALLMPWFAKGNPNDGLFIPLNNTVYMVLAIMPIMPENGLITDHNSCRIRCNRDPVVKPTQDQLVWDSNPTRTSSPGTHKILGRSSIASLSPHTRFNASALGPQFLPELLPGDPDLEPEVPPPVASPSSWGGTGRIS